MEDLIDKVKKSDSFQVPDGYFSELPDKVMARIEAEEKVAQVMEKYREGNSFSVPDGYFAALSDQVMARIGAADKRRGLFRRRLITAISVAASLVLVVGIGLLWYNFQNNGTTTENMSATVVEKPVTPPATAELTLPENTLAQVVTPEPSSAVPTASRRTAVQSKNAILEKKADDFIEKYADEELDVIDYDILDYFSEEDYIMDLLES
jgi:hypothetical protein